MNVLPVCPVYQQCGGCQYQHMSYADELVEKTARLKEILLPLGLEEGLFAPILPSPVEYNYRSRIDLKMIKNKNKLILFGFSPMGGKGLITIDHCPIAREEINVFIPTVRRQAMARDISKYKQASLVVRSGEGRNPSWGGLGHGSLRTAPKDYFWMDIQGRRVFYGLDTFFQANLFILPPVVEAIRALPIWSKESLFLDLYGGVGLFGISFHDLVNRVVLIEENTASITIARHNASYNKLDTFDVYAGKVEEVLPKLLTLHAGRPKIVMVDPPRAGLSDETVGFLNGIKGVEHMLYLSCNPESLRDNLKGLSERWSVSKIMPFDFFPKTHHLETLVCLKTK